MRNYGYTFVSSINTSITFRVSERINIAKYSKKNFLRIHYIKHHLTIYRLYDHTQT